MKKKASKDDLAARRTIPPGGFGELLRDIQTRIRTGQTRAVSAANAELVRLYWDIGRMIHERQERQGWGASVIPRLSAELRNELPELKGFSERNIGNMIAFYRAYPYPEEFLQQAAAKREILPQAPRHAELFDESLLWTIPWYHHIVLLQKVKDLAARQWYMQQTLASGWSRNVLTMMIESQAHRRSGKAITNFDQLLSLLSAPQSDLARETLKDPYIFDFLTLDKPFHERELETELVRHLEKFLLELGQGFAFVGRQYRLDVGGEDFYIDLLFYHLRLRAFVVIDLKTGPFKPEYAGKLNFYCNVDNDQLRHPDDQPTIGLILCQTKDNVLAEYALTGIDKAIGVSSYELTRALPTSLQSALPTVEELEAELVAAETREKTPREQMPKKKATKKTPKRKKRSDD